MHEVGIMQGRIHPYQTETLQVFPTNHWQKEFYTAKEIGFDYLELLYDIAEDPSNPLVSEWGIGALLGAASTSGTRLTAICADYFTQNAFLGSQEQTPWLRLTSMIEKAKDLSVPIIIIPFFNQNELHEEKDLSLFIEKVTTLAAFAKESGVRLCLESTLPAALIKHQLDSSQTNIAICYDLGNAAALGFDVATEIELLSHRIIHVHIKDRLYPLGANVQLGYGNLDFDAALKALKTIDYKGKFTLETAVGSQPYTSAKKNLTFFFEQLNRHFQ